MRAVALLGPYAREHHVQPFALPGVNLFSGTELDPTDTPDAALVFGGDGTIHRHLGGLALKQTPTLIVPIGSANDFAQSIGLANAKLSLAAWRRFCATGENVQSIDLGTIQPLEDSSASPAAAAEGSEAVPWAGESLEILRFVPSDHHPIAPKHGAPGTPSPRPDLPQMGERIMQSQLRRRSEAERKIARTTYFCCIAGTGLDAAVNRRTLQQSHWLRGHGGYVLALVQTLRGFDPPRITLSVERDGAWQTRLDEAGFLIAAGNAPQYGHGMRLTDRARMDDGLLDVCFVRTLSKLRLLRLFRVVYRGGHIGMNEVEYFQASRLRLATDRPMEVFADGEYICPTPVEIGLRPNALRVIVAA